MDSDRTVTSMEEYNKDISKWTYHALNELQREVQAKATDGIRTLSKCLRTNTHKDVV